MTVRVFLDFFTTFVVVAMNSDLINYNIIFSYLQLI